MSEKSKRVETPETTPLVSPWRIGVDVGGTFTDLALLDASGATHIFKVASTPDQPELGVVSVIEDAARELRLAGSALLGHCSLFVHGSTIATNALLEGKGARVGLLTTRGFRDSLEIRRGIRDNAWDHRTPYAPVLVPRYLRCPVGGRINRDGEEIEPLEPGDVEAAIRRFQQEGVESIAICLFNSFLNDAHERHAEQLLREKLPTISLNRSSAVAPTMGEYERSSTAVVSAYVAPRVAIYLSELSARLATLGLKQPMLIVQNSGGLQNVQSVIEHPASLLLSGPAAVTGALKRVAAQSGESNLISMEVGGTSCDVMLLHDGTVSIADAFDIAGYHVGLSAAQINTIGAGGGTLAGCDEAGMLWVGPQGAGAVPGPACYGRGGVEPTITDAELLLGRLAPGPFADGSFSLDLEKSERAIRERVAVPLRISAEVAAAGMLKLVEQKLTQAIESVTTAEGHDPRRFVLVAAGGAGPLLACAVARQLGARRVYVPRSAGALCALGMSLSDVRHEFARVHLARLNAAALPEIETLLCALAEQGREQLAQDGFHPSGVRTEASLSLRYPGQIGDLRVAVKPGCVINLDSLFDDFARAHEQLYGYSHSTSAVDVCAVRVVAQGDLSLPPSEKVESIGSDAQPKTHRDVYFDSYHGRVPTAIYAGAALRPGQVISGPVIVEELTTTILVYPGDVLEVDDYGNFLVQIEPGGDH